MATSIKKTDKTDELRPLLVTFLRCLLILAGIILLCILIGFGWSFKSVSAFLLIGGAYLLAGIILGFLFGMPRSSKFRYRPGSAAGDKDDSPWYTDNTNLEDVSDWLCKIIVGLSLVNFEKILKYTDSSAKGIALSISGQVNSGPAYALSYAMIFLFIFAGFIISYLWSFTTLRSILIKKKYDDNNLILDKNLANAVSAAASREAVSNQDGTFNESQLHLETIQEMGADPAFLDRVHEALRTHPVKDNQKDDLQKGRWSGKMIANDKKISASVKDSSLYTLFFDVTIKVMSVKKDTPYHGWVAFFIHDSFGFKDNTVYAKSDANGIASIPLVAYEAFTVGALCEDGTELELDLNDQGGFPDKFYYKD